MTVWLVAWIVPQCQPDVEPERQTELPTAATAEPATVTSLPLENRSTSAVEVPLVTRMEPKSSPGNEENDVVPRVLPSTAVQLEPMFVQYNVSLVLNGHDHVYERIKPQNGILYFVEGSSGQLRKGDLRKGSPLTAEGNDTTRTFMLMEIDGDLLTFNAIDMAGNVIDSGTWTVRKK